MDHPVTPGRDQAASPSEDAERSCSEISVTLRELAWSIHRKAPARAGVGPLPTTELAVLKQVLESPGTTVGALSLALGVQQPNVSAALRVLIERGLVTREAPASDRRRAHIHPTPQGVSEHRAISEAWAAPIDAALVTLSPDQRAALASAGDALQALRRALQSGAAG